MSVVSQLHTKSRAGVFSLDVEEIVIEKVISIQNNATIKEASKMMNEYEIGWLFLAKKREAVGIITERDALRRVV